MAAMPDFRRNSRKTVAAQGFFASREIMESARRVSFRRKRDRCATDCV